MLRPKNKKMKSSNKWMIIIRKLRNMQNRIKRNQIKDRNNKNKRQRNQKKAPNLRKGKQSQKHNKCLFKINLRRHKHSPKQHLNLASQARRVLVSHRKEQA